MTPENPIERFAQWFELATKAYPKDPNAVALATAGKDGRPSVRMGKGTQLLDQLYAALCFYWPLLQRQVRVEGAARPVTDAEADAYFASRNLAGALRTRRATDGFNALPPGKHNSIVRRIDDAAKPKTREKRIQQAVVESHRAHTDK